MLKVKWLNKYNLSKQYYLENGNLIIHRDYVTENNVKLGTWLHHQRKLYKNGKLSEEKINLLNEIGMNWKENSRIFYNWINSYNKVFKYYKKYHNYNFSYDYVTEDGFKIGEWVHLNRLAYKNNNLLHSKVELLKKINVIEEDYISMKWMSKYNLAKKFFEKYGNLKIPKDFITKDGITPSTDGVKLGSWIIMHRAINKGTKKGILTDKQRSLLDEIHMIWDASKLYKCGETNSDLKVIPKNNNIEDKTWLRNYRMAKKYFVEFNDLFVIFDYVT